jgi:hypothetical protein
MPFLTYNWSPDPAQHKCPGYRPTGYLPVRSSSDSLLDESESDQGLETKSGEVMSPLAHRFPAI